MRHVAVTPNRSETAAGSRHIPVLAILVLGASCSVTALGATNSMTARDHTANLQSLEVPVSELTVNVVGHIYVKADDENDESLNTLPAQDSNAAPVLDLAPRVAVILQDIFSAIAIETPPSDSPDQAQPYTIESLPQDESPLSPVAGDVTQPDSSELTDQPSGIEDIDSVPSIRRQMFRTDI